MLRTVIHEGAVSAAKAYCHAEVEPRHVLFALARHFRAREGCEACFAPAKNALEPRGSAYGAAPTVTEAATALLDTLKSDDDAIAALRKGVETGSTSGDGGAQAQTAEEGASQT